MIRARVIPTLLLQNSGLVKTKKFKSPVYIGDPINAVKLFNDKEVDELILLDINASVDNKPPPFRHLEEIVSESFMPLGYGGGIKTLKDIEKLFRIGIEKISLNTQAILNPSIVKEASEEFGRQSIVVSIDVKKNLFGNYHCYISNGKKNTIINPINFAKQMEDFGAGELYLTSFDREGTMKGYNLELIRSVAQAVSIPLIANGGAGTLDHFVEAIEEGKASAVTAGSMFVFHGSLRGILINYPSQEELKEKLYKS
jgi:imidazole glycerol-phosphate synthase subunit HisF